ncbi:MAG TPA: TadE/TadG family type IV pilus assembly protein [Allosphingosinicella sp.]|nr:TadE/TadG family type IV pilus assembly protein [Allosphingosinicella sp.]
MSGRSLPLLKRITRDRRGTSAIEFALVAPMLCLFVLAITDIARAASRKYMIEQASYRTLELVTVGSIKGDYSYLKPEAAAASGEPEANVTVRPWLECDGVLKEPFSETCTSSQQTARFIQLTIVSDFEPLFSSGPLGWSFGVNENGKRRLTARSTLRVQ